MQPRSSCSPPCRLTTPSTASRSVPWRRRTCSPPPPAFFGLPNPVLAAAISANGKRLLTGGSNVVALFQVGKPDTPAAKPPMPGLVWAVACDATGQLILAGGERAHVGEVRLWDGVKAPPRVFSHPDIVRSVALRPDGARF